MPVFSKWIQFDGFASYWPIWASVSIFLVTILTISFLLYRIHSHNSRRLKWLLISVRTVVIAAILLALFYDPFITSMVNEPVPAVVLVAIDQSESMRISEPQRPIAEKFNIAAKLKLTDVPTAKINAWKSLVESGSTPRFAGQNDPDKSDFEKTIAAVDQLSRLTASQKVLSPQGLNLLDRLRAIHNVELVGFDQQLSPLPADWKPAERKENSPLPLTDLSLPFARAKELGPACVGMILLSDGRHTYREPPQKNDSPPIYPVVTASKIHLPDIAIASAVPQSHVALKGSYVPIEIEAKANNWPNSVLKISVYSSQGELLATSSVGHPGGNASYPVSLKVKLADIGTHLFTVKVESAGTVDRLTINNQKTVSITTIKDRARILLIDQEARWEFHYLHTCLGRDPNVDLRTVVFDQPRLTIDNVIQLRTLGFSGTELPNADTLSAYDGIILGDVEPSKIPIAWRIKLEKYVADQGGTVVFISGKRAIPLEWSRLSNDPIQQLLPISQPKIFENEAGFTWSLTQDGKSQNFLNIAEKEMWNELPPHYWAITGMAKSGATTLANISSHTPLADAKSLLPLAVKQPYGFGKVLYLGIDSTWRWRYRVGDLHHHRFWGQVAQWAAADRLLPAVNASGSLRFGSREPIVRDGKPVNIIARTTDDLPMIKGQKSAKIIGLPDHIEKAERVIQTVNLNSTDEQARNLTATVQGLSPGRYAIELVIPELASELISSTGPDGQAIPLRANFEVQANDSEELANVSADWDWLQNTAQTSGGAVHTIDSIDELVNTLTQKTAQRERTIIHRWRTSWWLFGLVISILAIEWIARKWDEK